MARREQGRQTDIDVSRASWTDEERRRGFRNAANLATPKEGCLSALTANALYMLGKTAYPDIIDVDRKVNRLPGELMSYNSKAYLLLLNNNIYLDFIGIFDNERLQVDGINYLREFHKEEWDASYDKHYTADRVQDIQKARIENKEHYIQHKGKYRETVKLPDFNDIDTYLRNDYMVKVTLKPNHACLLFGAPDDKWYNMYFPKEEKPNTQLNTVFETSKEQIQSLWLPKAQIVGIKGWNGQ